jgi:Family of unknown function (DUF5996)
MSAAQEIWPPLPLTAWQDTYQTLHMYTQIVGKIRLAYSPMMNQWWQVPLYLTARGLTTSPIPYDHRTFEMEFDFFDHHLIVQTSDSKTRRIALGPPVKDFYREMMETLRAVGIEAHIWTQPVEVPDPIPFEKDNRHASYDPRHAHRFWQILKEVEIVFGEFRARFTGKCSPVHFFWGSFDLAVTRFSGRPAPTQPGADLITRLAYNAELSSLGFWPGGRGIRGTIGGAAFYSYTYPEPAGFRDQPVRPEAAFYHDGLGEFLLMYDTVRTLDDPRSAILDFAQSTYEVGARLQKWPLSKMATSKAPNPEGS